MEKFEDELRYAIRAYPGIIALDAVLPAHKDAATRENAVVLKMLLDDILSYVRNDLRFLSSTYEKPNYDYLIAKGNQILDILYSN